MNIDDFGEYIDDFLKGSEVRMMVTFPPGSMEADVQMNIPPSPVFQFYIMMHGMKKVFKDMLKLEALDESKKELILDAMLDLLKKGILEDEDSQKAAGEEATNGE